MVAGVDDFAGLSEGERELLLEEGDFLLEGTVTAAGFVAGPLGLSDGLGESKGFGAEFGDGRLRSGNLVLQVGDLALDVEDAAALGLDVILQVVPLDDDQAELVVLVVKLSLQCLDLDRDVAELLVGRCDFPLGLLETQTQVRVVCLDIAQACGLVLDLVAQTLDRSGVLVTLQLGGAEEVLRLVGLTLEGVVPLSEVVQLPCCLAVPGVGTLHLVLQAVLLIQEFAALVFQNTQAVGEGGDLLVSRLELASEILNLGVQITVDAGKVAVFASLLLGVVNGAVTLGLTVTQLRVASLKVGLVGVVVELKAGKRSLQCGEISPDTLLFLW